MWGNSLGYRLPKDIANEYHIKEGTELNVLRRPDGILLQPAKKLGLSAQTKKVVKLTLELIDKHKSDFDELAKR